VPELCQELVIFNCRNELILSGRVVQ